MTKEEAIKLIDTHTVCFYNEIDSPTLQALHLAIEALSADAVSREEYTETDGVVTIEKQNANEVGEIKHIVIHSPNYTRYFYNESMPTSADSVHGEWQKVEEQPYFRKHYDTVCCSVCRKKGNRKWNYCPNCGAIMKGGEEE